MSRVTPVVYFGLYPHCTKLYRGRSYTQKPPNPRQACLFLFPSPAIPFCKLYLVIRNRAGLALYTGLVLEDDNFDLEY